jgi:hypothetical protein
MKELEVQSIADYEFWPGVFVPSIKQSINLAHKQIVEYAKIAEWDEVFCAGSMGLLFKTKAKRF